MSGFVSARPRIRPASPYGGGVSRRLTERVRPGAYYAPAERHAAGSASFRAERSGVEESVPRLRRAACPHAAACSSDVRSVGEVSVPRPSSPRVILSGAQRSRKIRPPVSRPKLPPSGLNCPLDSSKFDSQVARAVHAELETSASDTPVRTLGGMRGLPGLIVIVQRFYESESSNRPLIRHGFAVPSLTAARSRRGPWRGKALRKTRDGDGRMWACGPTGAWEAGRFSASRSISSPTGCTAIGAAQRRGRACAVSAQCAPRRTEDVARAAACGHAALRVRRNSIYLPQPFFNRPEGTPPLSTIHCQLSTVMCCPPQPFIFSYTLHKDRLTSAIQSAKMFLGVIYGILSEFERKE